jgi:hypothetical protein
MVILTGSLALFMQQELVEREASDLDIILPYYIDLSAFGKIERLHNPYSTVCFSITPKEGAEIHVIVDPNCPYVTKVYGERLLKLSNAQDIWIEKFRSFIFFSTQKNCKDLNELILRNLVAKAPESAAINFEDLLKS